MNQKGRLYLGETIVFTALQPLDRFRLVEVFWYNYVCCPCSLVEVRVGPHAQPGSFASNL